MNFACHATAYINHQYKPLRNGASSTLQIRFKLNHNIDSLNIIETKYRKRAMELIWK